MSTDEHRIEEILEEPHAQASAAAPSPIQPLIHKNTSTPVPAHPSSPAAPHRAAAPAGWAPVPALLLAYFGATATFCLAFNIWEMPHLPWPATGNLLSLPGGAIQTPSSPPQQPPQPTPAAGTVHPAVLLLVLWGAHFLRRFAEVMFVHVYERTMTPVECVGACVYYCTFGLWVGWSVNIHLGYWTPPGWVLALGTLLFIVGEVGNGASHVALRRLRRPKRPKHNVPVQQPRCNGDECPESRGGSLADLKPPVGRVMPDGPLFQLVTCPNYMFEVISWLGFAIASFTLASYVFLACSLATMGYYAHQKHAGLRRTFDGKDGRPRYPDCRKRMIPFVF